MQQLWFSLRNSHKIMLLQKV